MEKDRSAITFGSCIQWAAKLNAESVRIRKYIEKFTVPILGTFTDSKPDPSEEKKMFLGSGVLLELFDCHFVITAGHCAESCTLAQRIYFGNSSASEIINIAHRYNWEKQGHEADDSRDWGYLRIDGAEFARAYDKRFLSNENLVVMTPPDLQKVARAAIIAGFQRDVAAHGEAIEPQFLQLVGLMEGCGIDLPEDRMFKATGIYTLISEELNFFAANLIAHSGQIWRQGISGGGVWIPGPERLDLSLAAITVAGNTYSRLSCAIAIGYVLRMICARESIPGLRGDILTRWPILAQEENWALFV